LYVLCDDLMSYLLGVFKLTLNKAVLSAGVTVLDVVHAWRPPSFDLLWRVIQHYVVSVVLATRCGTLGVYYLYG
jgi:hypothetical protein